MKKKKNTRKIGEYYCKRVKGLLMGIGHYVDGPFSRVIFLGRRLRKVHVDILGTFDLISIDLRGNILLHQVTALNMKSRKQKKIRTLGVSGYIWCYDSKNEENNFKIFYVTQEGTEEVEGLIGGKCLK